MEALGDFSSIEQQQPMVLGRQDRTIDHAETIVNKLEEIKKACFSINPKMTPLQAKTELRKLQATVHNNDLKQDLSKVIRRLTEEGLSSTITHAKKFLEESGVAKLILKEGVEAVKQKKRKREEEAFSQNITTSDSLPLKVAHTTTKVASWGLYSVAVLGGALTAAEVGVSLVKGDYARAAGVLSETVGNLPAFVGTVGAGYGLGMAAQSLAPSRKRPREEAEAPEDETAPKRARLGEAQEPVQKRARKK